VFLAFCFFTALWTWPDVAHLRDAVVEVIDSEQVHVLDDKRLYMFSEALYYIAPMQIRSPALTTEQITKWIRLAVACPMSRPATGRAPADVRSYGNHPGFDFKKARQALNRARSKTDVNTIKPLRRLRRNQGAVNEGLIDSFSSLIAVNKQMATEITALSADLAMLRQRLADKETPSSDNAFGQL